MLVTTNGPSQTHRRETRFRFIRRYVAHPQSQLDGVPVTAYRGDRSWRAAMDDVRRVQVELLIELGRLAERTPA